MKYNSNESEYILKSGKKFPSNHGLLGMNDELVLHEGYDGIVYEDEDFTQEERKEIAEYMIKLWKEWAK